VTIEHGCPIRPMNQRYEATCEACSASVEALVQDGSSVPGRLHRDGRSVNDAGHTGKHLVGTYCGWRPLAGHAEEAFRAYRDPGRVQPRGTISRPVTAFKMS